MKTIIPFLLFLITLSPVFSQTKILFDATKAETAGNADWVIDADVFNLNYNNGKPIVGGGGDEANAQSVPTPSQSNITGTTPETYWKGALSAWGTDCVKNGYTVETLPYNGRITFNDAGNAQDLSRYSVFIVCEPNILFTAAEKTAMLQYVAAGGSLFMISDHDVSDRNGDGWDSPAIWDDFINNNSIKHNPFGITFDKADISQTSSNIPNLPKDSILHGPLGSVTQVQWSGGTTITISTASNPTVKGIVYKTGSSFGSSNVLFAYAYYGAGKVAAIADSSPCDDGTGDPNDNLYNGYTQDANGNHRRLLMNASIWLAVKAKTLALQFIDIKAAHSGNTNIINWSVDETDGTAGFYEVQRSLNGSQYQVIATVLAHTPETAQSAYSYADANLANGSSYYRIKAVEKSSKVSYSPVIILKNTNKQNLQVKPNPVAAVLNAYFPQLSMPGSLKMCSANGNPVATVALPKGSVYANINTSNIAAGIYWLYVEEDGILKYSTSISKK